MATLATSYIRPAMLKRLLEIGRYTFNTYTMARLLRMTTKDIMEQIKIITFNFLLYASCASEIRIKEDT
jgi:hypothetical protein